MFGLYLKCQEVETNRSIKAFKRADVRDVVVKFVLVEYTQIFLSLYFQQTIEELKPGQ